MGGDSVNHIWVSLKQHLSDQIAEQLLPLLFVRVKPESLVARLICLFIVAVFNRLQVTLDFINVAVVIPLENRIANFGIVGQAFEDMRQLMTNRRAHSVHHGNAVAQVNGLAVLVNIALCSRVAERVKL